MVLRAITFKTYIVLVQCGRAISTLAAPSEYLCIWSCGLPNTILLFLSLVNDFNSLVCVSKFSSLVYVNEFNSLVCVDECNSLVYVSEFSSLVCVSEFNSLVCVDGLNGLVCVYACIMVWSYSQKALETLKLLLNCFIC